MVRRLALCVIVTLAALAAGQDATAQTMASQPALYTRLGGYDAIAAVTDSFIKKLVADPDLGKFFVTHSADSNAHVRQLVVDQLCAVTGGPCLYIGRSMKQAHAGLGITEAQWNTAVKHLLATLAEFKVPKKEQDDLVALVAPLKADIVDGAGATR